MTNNSIFAKNEEMKRVIIIGASSGVGEALVKHYAGRGCKLVIAARREERLQGVKNLFPDNISIYPLDVARQDQAKVREGVMSMIEMLGGADLVIYCSGVGKQNTQFDMGIEYATIDVNVKGFTTVAAAVVEYGKSVGHKVQFATISSVASTRGIGRSASYSATKMYQVRYMESLRQLSNKEGWGMCFTTIKPGFIDTDFIKGDNFPMTMGLDYAVKRIASAIDSGRSSKIIDWRWGMLVALWRLIPNWLWYRLKI